MMLRVSINGKNILLSTVSFKPKAFPFSGFRTMRMLIISNKTD